MESKKADSPVYGESVLSTQETSFAAVAAGLLSLKFLPIGVNITARAAAAHLGPGHFLSPQRGDVQRGLS